MNLDEKEGLIKVTWLDVREKVSAVEPTFVKLVDEISPDYNFPVYLAHYPYGAIIADTMSSYLPPMNSSLPERLSSPNIPKEIIKHLGYGKNSLPLGMVLEKELEYFIDLKKEGITIPWCVDHPGTFFPYARILGKKNSRIYTPNGVLTTSSGARSVFMLPNIGSLSNHINLQRDYNIQVRVPKSLYEQWYVFKEIANSKETLAQWRCCLIYFAENWVTKLINDPAWIKLKLYLHELAWKAFEFQRNQIYYNITFSIIQKKCNLKPNPYLVDTAKHLFTTALGAAPGYIPATNENALPLEILQKAFTESYGLKKYIPTIMQPANFNFENDKSPIYYSLQHPSTFVFSPKARKTANTLFEMRELEHIMKIFIKELSKENSLCSDTVINTLAKNIDFLYFHNELDKHNTIQPSNNVLFLDKRFKKIIYNKKNIGIKFSSDAKFLRGCIAIKNKNN